MSRVRWQDRITNEEVRRRCGVENLEHRLRKMRLRWFGHVKRRDENNILRRVIELEVEGRRPVGRTKKTWSKVVEENMRKLNITKDIAEDRQQRWRLINVQHQEWETRGVNPFSPSKLLTPSFSLPITYK